MKTIILLLTSVLILSCSKSNDDNLAPYQQTSKPSVTSATWSAVNAGANESVKFNVKLSVPVPVSMVNLIHQSDNNKIVWTVNDPVTGNYTMYDHTNDFPTYNEFSFYQFQFVMKDGTKSLTEKFQVY